MKKCVTRKAYAKINLGLDVIRRRPDGYHEVKMIMQTVDLWDELTFYESGKPGVSLTIQGDDRSPVNLPVGKDNLICRSAEFILEQFGIREGVCVELKKRIPIAAGMAGGSTDAAAVFHGLNELFSLGMSLEDMKKLGVRIGADVPYCIMGGTALAEGIGEKLTRLPPAPACVLVVAKPDISVSTGFVYENLGVDRLKEHPDIDGMTEAIRMGSLKGITDRMANVLETVTVKKYPVICEIKERMRREGAENALMSGSGPTVFGIFTEKGQAEAAAEAIGRDGLSRQVFVTGFYNGDTEERRA